MDEREGRPDAAEILARALGTAEEPAPAGADGSLPPGDGPESSVDDEQA